MWTGEFDMNTLWSHNVWTRIFSYPEKKSCGLKNIRIRVDGASIFTISLQSPQQHKIPNRIVRERRNCFFRYSCKTLRWQRFHDFYLPGSARVFSGFEIWAKYGAGIGKTINILTGSGIWLFPGKRDSSKIGRGMWDLCLRVCRECRKPSQTHRL